MALMPGAEHRLIARHNRIRATGMVRVNLHVAVSEARSLHGYFSTVGVCSHFYVRKDGGIEQYIDTRYRSGADLEGNGSTISVETQGGLRDAQSEPWTTAQLASLARIFAWACQTHGIPARLATDSRPGASSHGLSWHRLGIDPWRVAGGLRYSNSRGKVCPGNAKIAQIPALLATTVGAGGPLHGDIPTAPDLTLPEPLEELTMRETFIGVAPDGKNYLINLTEGTFQHILDEAERNALGKRYGNDPEQIVTLTAEGVAALAGFAARVRATNAEAAADAIWKRPVTVGDQRMTVGEAVQLIANRTA